MFQSAEARVWFILEINQLSSAITGAELNSQKSGGSSQSFTYVLTICSQRYCFPASDKAISIGMNCIHFHLQNFVLRFISVPTSNVKYLCSERTFTTFIIRAAKYNFVSSNFYLFFSFGIMERKENGYNGYRKPHLLTSKYILVKQQTRLFSFGRESLTGHNRYTFGFLLLFPCKALWV